MVARLEELNVFACCVDIFFENPWNNFVHHQVYLLLSRVLSSSSEGAIVERMLRSSQLPQKLIGEKDSSFGFCCSFFLSSLQSEAFGKYESREAGYFGHALELCNEVLNCASMRPDVQVGTALFCVWWF